MKLQTICKHCGSDHVRLIDNLPIYLPTALVNETNVAELYQWDEEIYATCQCDNCGKYAEVQGTINWNV